jgi:alpha-soluble NSF attachment protein
VKEYWLKASLCGLAAKVRTDAAIGFSAFILYKQDPASVKRNMGRYATLDTSFPSTREAKFVNALLDAINSGDPDQYTAIVGDYDQVTPLDNWKTSILLKIKKQLDEEPDLR